MYNGNIRQAVQQPGQKRVPLSEGQSFYQWLILQPEPWQYHIIWFRDLSKRLSEVKAEEKPSFLLDTIGKEKIRKDIKEIYQLCWIIDLLPSFPLEIRYNFLLSLYSEEEIREFAKDHQAFRQLKKRFLHKQRAQLNRIIYNEEELAVKAILSRIRRKIKETRFDFGIFETKYDVDNFKNVVGQKSVPEPVMRQIEEFYRLHRRVQTHADALKNIRSIGERAAHPPNTCFNMFKKLAISKSETEKYYDNFANEESFSKAFKPIEIPPTISPTRP